jgi:hypothetical protein
MLKSKISNDNKQLCHGVEVATRSAFAWALLLAISAHGTA